MRKTSSSREKTSSSRDKTSTTREKASTFKGKASMFKGKTSILSVQPAVFPQKPVYSAQQDGKVRASEQKFRDFTRCSGAAWQSLTIREEGIRGQGARVVLFGRMRYK